jgi:3',5'-cyclic AMP phosphodiesterase CpdA
VRIVQLSDTHISHLGGVPAGNMSLLADHINHDIRPDLVVHTGDVVIADPDSGPDRDAAKALLARIDAPLLVLPGNHDVGESADSPWQDLAVTSERIAAFTSAWGQDRFLATGSAATRSDNWVFIGINSERLGSGLPEEREQWDWLADAAGQARSKSVMLFLHKPLWFPTGSQSGITVPVADRERLVALFADARLRVVSNGHLHRFRRAFQGEILAVWAPSMTFAVTADPGRGLEGESAPGIVEYRIEDDDVQAELRQVPGTGAVSDVLAMPEFTAALAEIESR